MFLTGMLSKKFICTNINENLLRDGGGTIDKEEIVTMMPL